MTTQQHARGTAPGPATSRAEPRGIGFRDLADACLAQYTGRDKSLCARVGWWVERLGDTPVQDINDDLVFAALEAYASGEALRPAGKDVHGRLIMRGCGRPRSNASVNRMHAALGTLMRFA
ncbi:MAG TPA: hypothetical protein VLD36_20135, partial [Burkholderiales bacterium]|nr:hypothetical protein [Burkholderiales bacterium]